jgi:hypothetical protein
LAFSVNFVIVDVSIRTRLEPLQVNRDAILNFVSYAIASAIVVPIGMWLKSEHLFGFGDWVVSWFQ